MNIVIDQEIVEGYKSALNAAISELNRLTTQKPAESDDPINAQAVAAYLGMTKAAVYQNLAKIPHRKRHGKLYFFKSELRHYLETGTA